MFFKPKAKPKYAQITSINQVKAHLREFILDSQIPDGDAISEDLGCAPLSDELWEKEIDESERRIAQISYLTPLLYGYSALFSEAFVSTIPIPEIIQNNPQSEKLIKEITNNTKKLFEDAMAHLLVGSVSQMVDLGLLEMPKGKK